MSYGPVAGSGDGYLYELEELAGEVLSGCVIAPLCTTDGETLYTTDGKELYAYSAPAAKPDRLDTSTAAAVTGLVRMIEEERRIRTQEDEELAAGVLRGEVCVPLCTTSGEKLYTTDGKELCAYSAPVTSADRLDVLITVAVTGLVRLIEEERNIRAQEDEELSAGILRGEVYTPLFAANGEALYATNGKRLYAYQIRDDWKAYADRAAAKAVAELSATVERYQAQNEAMMQAISVGIMSGQFAVQLAAQDGTGIMTTGGEPLAAVNTF